MSTNTSSPPDPTLLDQITSDAGLMTSLASGVGVWAKGAPSTILQLIPVSETEVAASHITNTSLRAFLSNVFNNPLFAQLTAGIGTALAFYGFYKALKAGNPLGIGMASVGLGLGIYTLGLLVPGAWLPYLAVMAALVVITILISLFGGGPSPEEKAVNSAVQQLTTVLWTPGPMAMVGVGTAFLLLGLPNDQTPPVMSTLTNVPAYYLAQTLLATTGSANIPLNSKTPTVLVEPGASPTDPEKVMIVTNDNSVDSYGNPTVTIQTFELFKNLQFISNSATPQTSCYIPVFTGNPPQLNTAYTNGMTTQNKMLEAILNGALSTQGSTSAMQIASAANKNCILPDS